MTKLIIAAIGAIAGAALWYLKWRLDPERRLRRDRKDRDKAHVANADKDGVALNDWFIRRRRK